MQTHSDAPRVLIAASGTGGHLLPAIAIAKAIQDELPQAKLTFVGAGRSLEAELIRGSGFELRILPLKPLRRLGFKGLLKWLVHLPKSIISTVKLLKELNPDLAVGVGGYASVIPLIMARLRGCKTLIHEAERTPGWANKLLAKIVHRITTAHKQTKFPRTAPTVYTGHPIREALLLHNFNKALPAKVSNLFIVGGSQGARTLDLLGKELVPLISKYQLAVTHQCRPEHQTLLKEAYQKAQIKANVQPFITTMENVYHWSDVVIARAGAGLVRELELIGRPALLVPLPNAQEQLENAQDLAASGQAVVVEEGADFYQRACQHLEQLLQPETYARMARFEEHKQPPQSPARQIAKVAIELLNPDISYHSYCGE